MKVAFSKSFIKAASRLSGKMKDSLREIILEVERSVSVADIIDCKKLTGFNYVYRIRMGNYRAFFIFHV